MAAEPDLRADFAAMCASVEDAFAQVWRFNERQAFGRLAADQDFFDAYAGFNLALGFARGRLMKAQGILEAEHG